MKKLFKLFMFNLIFFSSVVLFAQLPPDPGSNPNSNPNSRDLGGNAPIGTGITILLTLSAVYGGRKIYFLVKDGKE